MMSNYTPGLWSARPFPQDDDLWAVINDRGKLVITTSNPADAQVIALTPEMVELLKAARVELDKVACLSPREDWVDASNLAQSIKNLLRRINREEE